MAAPTPQKVFSPLNPLDRQKMAARLAKALLNSPIHPLPPKSTFSGSGIYAIYYTGDFPLYKNIATKNVGGKMSLPIYVGKAVPKGTRKGSSSKGDDGTALSDRL